MIWLVFVFKSSKELAHEANPSDHPRASTLFLNKSQTDGQYFTINDYCRLLKSNLKHVIPFSVSFQCVRREKATT